MEWIDLLKQRLFGETVERTGQLHHGLLKRSPSFAARHAEWLSNGEFLARALELQEWLEREERYGDVDGMHLFSDAKATGFQFRCPEQWPEDSLEHLLDAFRDRVIALGYRIQLSDHRIDVQGVHRERHYLKPDLQQMPEGGLLDQRYGNILLETWGGDHGARHFKVLATVYSDRLYSPPLPGKALLSALLDVRGLPFS
jgi:hypothetical protein